MRLKTLVALLSLTGILLTACKSNKPQDNMATANDKSLFSKSDKLTNAGNAIFVKVRGVIPQNGYQAFYALRK